MRNKILLYVGIFLLLGGCTPEPTNRPFVTVRSGQFYVGENPYRFVGTNFWYGGILGSEGQGGNRERLIRELDFMHSKGIDNLRILVGADGVASRVSKVEPVLQLYPGIYNDTLFRGLDFLLSEMGKRDMRAVLYLNNSWEWSGGYSQYLEWSGEGPVPVPAVDGFGKFHDYVARYAANASAHRLFMDHVRHVVSRTNVFTGVAYRNDPTIMAWQIGNEPRPFGERNKEAFVEWLAEIASLIKSLDPNHLLSIGSEGSAGCEGDIDLWKTIHANPNINYCTIHIWPNNWGWLDKQNMKGSIDRSIEKTKEYIGRHARVASELAMPMVLEEFGFPRDSMRFGPGTPTRYRDRYYEAVFGLIGDEDCCLSGCNFWAWGGFGRPSQDGNVFWKRGDDYLGDPAQEEQGLNSVYDTDSTVALIERYTRRCRDMAR